MKKFVLKYIDKHLMKFLIVGVLNTLFGYSLFALFIFLGINYPVAVLLATILGVLFNYKSIGKLVFDHKGDSRLFHFVSVYVLIYLLNVSGLWALDIVGLENKYIAGAMLLVPLAVVSFVLNKKFVFNQVDV